MSSARRRTREENLALAREWRRLGRIATAVAVLTSPALYAILKASLGWSTPGAIAGTLLGVFAFRGAIDVLAHRFIPAPSLTGVDDKEEDVVSRRRLWYWRSKFKRLRTLLVLATVVIGSVVLFASLTGGDASIGGALSTIGDGISAFAPQLLAYMPIIVLLFLANFLILFGPLAFLGIQQIKSYEPGDADWGVKLEDVRGQAEAREEITRVVALWESGEEFEQAGGKRERGVLFLGPPGTGKTMLSKGIATSFNCPFVTIPGSGFAQTFIGMDAIIVRYLARKAKKLAAKWGGQCIVFIDEIDAVGLRRQSLGTGFQPEPGAGGDGLFGPLEDDLFFGPWGARNPSGDLVVETAAWRDRLFAQRAEQPRGPHPYVTRAGGVIERFMMPGGMMGGGGGLALNQLLVVMDGIDDPPWTKKVVTNRVNTVLDALYVVPRRVKGRSLRLAPPKPRKEEIYFIGACNVPIEMLDPALTRPGRMGRHIFFRTPTWEDRRDIFDLYIKKVAHEPELDTPKKRDELARVTNGYSPAMIDQVCSMALTLAHSDGRDAFGWTDITEAMTTVESGVAINQPYPAHESRSIAIHEAGHAVCSHLYNENLVSTRLSIRKRGYSGGHHAAMEVEDRFVNWRSEEIAGLVHTLGAMAAEIIFYGQNTTGVGGDVHQVTAHAARMVGAHAMGPTRVDLADRIEDPDERDAAEQRVMERFERIGRRIMNRTTTSGSALQADPIGTVLADSSKQQLVAQLVGQAFVIAYCTIQRNRDGTEAVADALVERKELYGDEVVDLLDGLGLVKPEIDVLEESTWPRI